MRVGKRNRIDRTSRGFVLSCRYAIESGFWKDTPLRQHISEQLKALTATAHHQHQHGATVHAHAHAQRDTAGAGTSAASAGKGKGKGKGAAGPKSTEPGSQGVPGVAPPPVVDGIDNLLRKMPGLDAGEHENTLTYLEAIHYYVTTSPPAQFAACFADASSTNLITNLITVDVRGITAQPPTLQHCVQPLAAGVFVARRQRRPGDGSERGRARARERESVCVCVRACVCVCVCERERERERERVCVCVRESERAREKERGLSVHTRARGRVRARERERRTREERDRCRDPACDGAWRVLPCTQVNMAQINTLCTQIAHRIVGLYPAQQASQPAATTTTTTTTTTLNQPTTRSFVGSLASPRVPRAHVGRTCGETH